jgi:hypothetical protein
MKKLPAILALLPAIVWAQVSPGFNSGQILSAASLNSAFGLAAAATNGLLTNSTANTQGYLDNSTLIATDQFAKRSILAATATIPIAGMTGGTYNFASAGTGANLVVFVSSGVVTSILTIAAGGSGYQVGDCLILNGGNGDAIARVTSVSSGAVTAASVLYGGTGYTTGATLAVMALPPGSRTGNLMGALTSNALIIVPAGTYLQGARRFSFTNNTTGAFTVTVKLSNGSGGSMGTGVVLPQGTNNSTSILLYTDGVNDVWPEVNAFPSGVTCTGTPSSSFATVNGIVTHC